MASIILTGATGTAGRDALLQALNSARVARVTVLSRRPLDPEFHGHPKINYIEHLDFNSYPSTLLSQLNNHSACIWCLGIASGGMTEADYRVITRDYAVEAAKAFSQLSDKDAGFSFVFVSGLGATWNPGYLTAMFGKVKGETEKALAQLPQEGFPSLRVHSCRPGGIRPTNPKPNLTNTRKFLRGVMQLPVWSRSMVIESADLGEAMLRIALPSGPADMEAVSKKGGATEQGVWSNAELRRLIGK